jgi:hypothetical protein
MRRKSVTEPSRIRSIADWMVIVVFVGAIGLPLVGALFDAPFNISESDGRQLADWPKLCLKGSSLKAFPAAFEKYWDDHFGFRGTLIRGLTAAKVRWLHVSSSANVLLGRATWLFYVQMPVGADHAMLRPFTEGELDRWQQVLEHRRDWLARRGCRYLLFLPPEKQTIYPEYLDPCCRPKRLCSRLDQLVERLRTRSSVEVVDVRPQLRAAKQRERLYHVTDSHWNDRGAFLGYQEVTAALTKWFPAVRPLPRSAFAERAQEQRGGDLAKMISLKELDHEEWLSLAPLLPRQSRLTSEGVVPPPGVTLFSPPFATECDDLRLPRAVMFHDSFVLAMLPFLSEHFRRIAYVWHPDFHPDVVEREQPEIVLHELVERQLGLVTPNDIQEESGRNP